MLTKDGLYPVVDRPIGWIPGQRALIRAQWTGEAPRMIQPGEYYLSGAVIEAYRADAEIGPYHPARLVYATPVTTYKIEPAD